MSGGGWGRGAAIITRASLSVWIRTAKKILSSHIGTSMLLGGGGGADARARTHSRTHSHLWADTTPRPKPEDFTDTRLFIFKTRGCIIFFFALILMYGGSQKKPKKWAVRLEKKGLWCQCVCTQRRPLSVWLLGKTWPNDLTWLLRFLNCGRLLYFCRAAFHIQQNLTRGEI